MEPSINLTAAFISANFSQQWRDQLSQVLQAHFALTFEPDHSPAAQDNGRPSDHDEDWELSDLSPAQARKVVANASDRVRLILKAVAEAPLTGFDMVDVVRALGDEEGTNPRGALTAITRRVRSVLGDEEAYLFHWVETQDGRPWKGYVSPTTYAALRKAFDLKPFSARDFFGSGPTNPPEVAAPL